LLPRFIVQDTLRKLFSTIIVSFILAALAVADPTTLPATNPAATQPAATRAAHVTVVPPGYHEITIGTRSFLCLPEDDSWIHSAVATASPATRPTTMPADILQNVAQRRGQIIQQIVTELGLADTKAVDAAFDKEMIPPLEKMRDVEPKVYYFPITPSDLQKLIEAGWSDPRYEYNRNANNVHYIEHVDIALDHQPDDVVIWARLADGDSSEQRSQALVSKIAEYENQFMFWKSAFAQTGVRHVMTALVRNEVTDKLNLPETLSWFGIGLSNVYAIKYSEMIAGTPANDVIRVILLGDQRNPMPWRPLDLMHPIKRDAMKPEYAPYYLDAAEHKGTFIAQQWVNKAGKDSLVKTLAAMRQKPPTTPDELIQIVKAASGIDITPWMLPDFHTN
jgi:hypothetical protein